MYKRKSLASSFCRTLSMVDSDTNVLIVEMPVMEMDVDD
jgi:hypothetical protein